MDLLHELSKTRPEDQKGYVCLSVGTLGFKVYSDYVRYFPSRWLGLRRCKLLLNTGTKIYASGPSGFACSPQSVSHCSIPSWNMLGICGTADYLLHDGYIIFASHFSSFPWKIKNEISLYKIHTPLNKYKAWLVGCAEILFYACSRPYNCENTWNSSRSPVINWLKKLFDQSLFKWIPVND